MASQFRQLFYLLGILAFVFSLSLICFVLVYTQLCYTSSTLSTGQCRKIQFYSQTDNDQSVVQLNRLSQVARYNDVCQPTHGVNDGSETSVDFYDAVQMEMNHLSQSNRSSQMENLNLDDAYVLLPNHSGSISQNNISNSLFLYYAFAQNGSNLANKNQVANELNYIITILAIALRQEYCVQSNQTNQVNSHSFPWIKSFSSPTTQHQDHNGYQNNNNQQQQYFNDFQCAFDVDVLTTSTKRVIGLLECLPEDHGLQYASVMIRCNTTVLPTSVTLIKSGLSLSASGLLPVIYSPFPPSPPSLPVNSVKQNKRNKAKGITLCVRPLFGSINVLNLLEFIAYYQTNGVTLIELYHFAFDSPTSTSNTSRRANVFLSFMSKIQGVRLRSFVLPKVLYKKVHSGAQIITVHDCLLRHSDSVQIHVDIDEFIFAKAGTTIRQLVEQQLEAPVSYVALYVPSVLHCHEFNLKNSKYYEFDLACLHCAEQQQTNQSSESSLTASSRRFGQYYRLLDHQTVRTALMLPNNLLSQRTVWPHKIRSKVIVLQPHLVQHMGIHSVHHFDPKVDRNDLFDKFKRGLNWLNRSVSGTGERASERSLYTYLNIDPSIAIVRHYRWCCQIQQTYFFDLLRFYSVEDDIVGIDFPNDFLQEPQRNSAAQQQQHQMNNNHSRTWTTKKTSQMQSFVLCHFRRYLTAMLTNQSNNNNL